MTEAEKIMHEALEKIRLFGSLWWKDSWSPPSKIANEALNKADSTVDYGD